MPEKVLLLTPSRGRGGGIERYTDTLQWAFAEREIECRRLDLSRSGASAHARMLLAARDDRARLRPSRIVATHRSLLPTAWLLGRGSGISVVCHGNDVWGGGHLARRSLEARLMRGAGVRVVAVSSFTAGALSRVCHASVLPPGLSREWFDMLVRESSRSRACGRETRLVTTFRLAQWRSKGLPQLLEAVAALGRSDLRVTVCGVGPPPEDLQRRVRQDNLCVLRAGLSDRELACELAAADLFVLATRTVTGRRPSGEGFGVALLEAQVAGTPVIGPAYGGSHERICRERDRGGSTGRVGWCTRRGPRGTSER